MLLTSNIRLVLRLSIVGQYCRLNKGRILNGFFKIIKPEAKKSLKFGGTKVNNNNLLQSVTYAQRAGIGAFPFASPSLPSVFTFGTVSLLLQQLIEPIKPENFPERILCHFLTRIRLCIWMYAFCSVHEKFDNSVGIGLQSN